MNNDTNQPVLPPIPPSPNPPPVPEPVIPVSPAPAPILPEAPPTPPPVGEPLNEAPTGLPPIDPVSLPVAPEPPISPPPVIPEPPKPKKKINKKVVTGGILALFLVAVTIGVATLFPGIRGDIRPRAIDEDRVEQYIEQQNQQYGYELTDLQRTQFQNPDNDNPYAQVTFAPVEDNNYAGDGAQVQQSTSSTGGNNNSQSTGSTEDNNYSGDSSGNNNSGGDNSGSNNPTCEGSVVSECNANGGWCVPDNGGGHCDFPSATTTTTAPTVTTGGVNNMATGGCGGKAIGASECRADGYIYECIGDNRWDNVARCNYTGGGTTTGAPTTAILAGITGTGTITTTVTQPAGGNNGSNGGGGGSSGGGGGTGTVAPTGTAPACVQTRVYTKESNGQFGTTTTPIDQLGSKVKIGDVIRLAIRGNLANFTKGRFLIKINGAVLETQETTTKQNLPGDAATFEYVYDYTITRGGNYSVEGAIWQ